MGVVPQLDGKKNSKTRNIFRRDRDLSARIRVRDTRTQSVTVSSGHTEDTLRPHSKRLVCTLVVPFPVDVGVGDAEGLLAPWSFAFGDASRLPQFGERLLLRVGAV